MGAIKSEFEEYGVAEDVLADLQEVCKVFHNFQAFVCEFSFLPCLTCYPLEMGD
jgi:hypothetical protein